MSNPQAQGRVNQAAEARMAERILPGVLTAIAAVLALAGGAAALYYKPMLPEWGVAVLGALAVLGAVFLMAAVFGRVRFGGTVRSAIFFQAVLDSMEEPCAICDKRNRLLYTNRAYKAFIRDVGVGRQIGVDGLYAGYPEISERIYRLSLAAQEGERAREDLRLNAGSAAAGARPDRSAWIRVSVEPVESAPARGLVMWRIIDLTEDRMRQEQAFEHLQYIIDYLDHAPAGFFSAAPDGRIDYINATLANWLKIDLAKTTGGALSLRDIVTDDGSQLLAGVAGKPAGSSVEVFDLDFASRDGQLVPVRVIHRVDFDEEGAQKPSRSLVLDMRGADGGGTQAESAEVRFARLFNNAPIGIAEVDDTGHIRNANGAFARLAGEKAARGTAVIEIIDEESRPAFAKAMVSAREASKPLPPVDVRVSGKKGAGTAQVFLSRIEEGEEKSHGFIVYAVDTTEHRTLEMQFAQSQKMQAVGQLAGGIAHDFNNVLTAIIGFSDLLLAKQRPTDPSFKDIMNIKQNANRAANLVRQLLAFSRQQTLRPEILSLTDVLSDLGNLLGRLLGEKIELQMIHGRDLWPVKVDVNQFEQVVMNLAVNARDAMPEGGALTIRTANVTLDQSSAAQPDVLPPGEYVLCEVSDTGVGMSEEVAEKIYEPFFSTKEVGKGTGLGLSTVYGIVKQTGGFIFCNSVPGEGTTFRIYLPRHFPVEEVAPVAKGEKRDVKRADLTGKGTVLLVEDEEAVRAFAARALAQRGYTILEAESGATALALADENKGNIDLVLSDVVMPEMDGPSLLKELRARGVDSKVIFISGYAEDTFRKNVENTEDFAFLPKPFSLKQLAAAVKNAMDG